MPELRLNVITGQWVVIESSSDTDPTDFRRNASILIEVPNISRACHFCKGNEHILQDEILRVPGQDDWMIRVIKNKYSRLSEDGIFHRWGNRFCIRAKAVGSHEIFIETPYHNHSFHNMSLQNIKEIILAWRDRYNIIHKDENIKHIVLFKNYGLSSGTQIEHSLSHLVGMPIVPSEHRSRTEAYIRFYDDIGSCLMCNLIDDEIKYGERVVMQTKHFICLVPFAALSPFHLWIFPLQHSVSILDITEEQAEDFALILKTCLLKLYFGLNNPDYNFTIRMSTPKESGINHMHWYMSIVPRIGYFSGFEISSGMYFNPLLPEKTALYLREQASYNS